MTITAGQPWGEMVAAPIDADRVGSDEDLASVVAHAVRAGTTASVIVTAGDLFRAVGGTDGVDRTLDEVDIARLPCDALRVDLDDRTYWAVAHVVVHRRILGSSALGWWRGRIVAMMNVQYRGEWDVAPRAHPNDGRVDVVEVDRSMAIRDRWRARGRLPLGAHVPHPSIRTRQVRSLSLDLEPGDRVVVDGVDRGAGRRLGVTVQPDAFTVHV